MRPNPSLLAPALKTLPEQNQLGFQRMARLRAPVAASTLASVARAMGASASAVVAGLVLLAVGSIGATAYKAGGLIEPVGLGLLALLAAAGVFLVFGLISGFLRLTERAAEADIVKSVADNFDTGLQIVSRTGAVLYRNQALRDLAGTRSGRQATLEEVFAGEPQSTEAFYRLNRAADRGEMREEEVYVRPTALDIRGGRWLQVSVAPFRGTVERSQDAPLTLWQVRDVTRERTREFETVGNLRSMLALYDDLPQGLLAVAPDGRIAHVNTTLAQWLGVKAESARVLTLADVVSADGAALIRAAGRAQRVTRLDLDLLREDGRALPVHLVCRGHGLRGVLSILVLDRSESTQEKTRVPSEVQLARAVQAAPFGIATVAADGRILDANTAFTRMFLRDDGLPERVDDLAASADERAGEELTRALQRAYSGRTGASPVEVFLGPQREFARRIYVSPLGTGARSREGAILYAIDATEQKELELKFAQSHKMEAVGQLAGGVAHDFNNVLTAIIGFSDLLLQTHRPTDPAYRDIMNIKSSANRAAGLVRQLLAYSRRQTLQSEVLELGELLTDLSALLNKALGEKIALKILPGRDLWHVKVDKTQFEHVIINLAVNARDAMPAGGRLTIRLRNVSERESLKLAAQGVTGGEYLLVEVEDTGTGIPPDVIGRIFEPFFTTKEVGKGTGLGLSTVYGIVKQTGGYIFADSEMDKGTTFRIYLPRHIVETEDELPQRARKVETTRDLTGVGRVLLVEDEDVVRSFAARALARQGYQVLEAGSGAEALELMQRDQKGVDLVVSDVIMPEMDGPTLLKELRKSKPDLKFIFVSGYPDDAFKKSLDDGADYAFLPKPFTLPQLAAKVKEQLER